MKMQSFVGHSYIAVGDSKVIQEVKSTVVTRSDVLLRIVMCDALVPAITVHAHRNLVHLVIVDDFPAEHRSAWLPLPKVRSRIAPEVAAVGDDTAGKRVLRPISAGPIP